MKQNLKQIQHSANKVRRYANRKNLMLFCIGCFGVF